jgi:uncharacterized protein with gpF-like domain
MDGKVCSLCEKMNGTVVRADSAIMGKYNPPVHYNCRCVWLPITREEIKNPGQYDETKLTLNDKSRPVSVDDVNQKIGKDISLKTFCECGG